MVISRFAVLALSLFAAHSATDIIQSPWQPLSTGEWLSQTPRPDTSSLATSYAQGAALDGLVRSSQFNFSLAVGSASATFIADGRFLMRVGALTREGRWRIEGDQIVTFVDLGENYIFKVSTRGEQFFLDLESRSFRFTRKPATRIIVRTNRPNHP